MVLTVVGALGILSWIWMIRAVKAGKSWAPWAATTMFALGTSVALTALLVKDTSGDTGLPPLLGWIGVLPCLAGLEGTCAKSIGDRSGHSIGGPLGIAAYPCERYPPCPQCPVT